MSKSPENGRSGFTLVEVLVALTILSISLAAILRVLAVTLDRTRESQAGTIAISLAQTLVAQAGSSIRPRLGESTGEFPGGFRWRLEVQTYGSAEDQTAWPSNAVSLSASVTWGQGNKSVTVSTLRLAPKDRP